MIANILLSYPSMLHRKRRMEAWNEWPSPARTCLPEWRMPAKSARLRLRLAIAERGMFVRIGSRTRTATFSVGALCCGIFSAAPAQISIDVGVPSAGLGLHIQQYPNLAPVPRYPVYYGGRN